MVRIAIGGCAGRMGSLIAGLALEDRRFRVVGALESPGHHALGSDLGQWLGRPSTQVIITEEPASALADAQVLIEFTAPEATLAHARAAARHQVAMVIGTTGLTSKQQGELRRLARRIPLFYSPNMSLGVLVLRRMLAEGARLLTASGLDKQTTCQIIETHHIHKKDKPSGTAKQLADDLARTLPHRKGPIPIQSRREGEVVGVHEVTLALGKERLRVEHEALSREIFAQGALVAARFLAERTRRPGYYDMDRFAQSLVTPSAR